MLNRSVAHFYLLVNPDRNPHKVHTRGRTAKFLSWYSRQTVLLLAGALSLLAACGADESTPPATPPPAVDPIVATVAVDHADAVPVDQVPESEPAEAPSAPAATATPQPDPEQDRLELWHSWAGADADALSAILADFDREISDFPVDTLFVAFDELPQAYADAVRLGGGPDLVVLPNWWLSDLVTAQVVLPLDEVVPPEQIAGYWPATTENLRRDQRLYGLPVHFDLVSLFVNGNLVEREDVPDTTEALLAAALADPTQGAGIYANLYHLYWGLPAYGAELIDGDGAIVLDRGAGAGEFLTWLQALNGTPGSFVDLDYGMLLDRFKKGEFAYFVDGPWATRELQAALGDKLFVASLPAGPAGPARPWLSADGVFVNPTLDDLALSNALLLATHLTNAESGRTWAEVANRLPAHREADVGADLTRRGFMAQATDARSMPTLPEMDEVWGYSGDMIVKVLGGVMDAEAAVAEAAALINDANGR